MANPNDLGLDVSKLCRVRSLREAFELFGVEAGDRIDTRELVIMTTTIEAEMKRAKKGLQEKRDYEAAALLRDRLSQIRQEFLNIQLEDESTWQQRECCNFDSAFSASSGGVTLCPDAFIFEFI